MVSSGDPVGCLRGRCWHTGAMTSTASPGDDEAWIDTYTHRVGLVFADSNGNSYTVGVTASDCDDDTCQRCYEPFLVSIEPVDPLDPSGQELPQLEFQIDDLDRLIEALRAARRYPAL